MSVIVMVFFNFKWVLLIGMVWIVVRDTLKVGFAAIACDGFPSPCLSVAGIGRVAPRASGDWRSARGVGGAQLRHYLEGKHLVGRRSTMDKA